MGRFVVLALLLSCAIGCRNRPAQLDPFLGTTKVTPPPTGAIHAPTGVPPMAPPPSSSVYTPPGGFTPNNASAVSTPGSPSSTPARFTGTNSSTTTAPPSSGVGSSGQSIRIVEPPPGTRSASTQTAPPSRAGLFTGAASGGVDILDLPVSSRAAQPRTASGGGAVQQSYVSGGTAAGVDTAQARVVTLPGQEPAYGFDAAYSQLNGRLEYSPADGRWLLRYITPGERSDRLGGMVVLSPNTPVSGFRNGDMVTLHGRMDNDGGGVSLPTYTATSVRPQREQQR
ncbi:MAG: hypothetical protein JNL96_26250 [Planctomycetaceae bacterium]|nr:hypothetical protein [Planctomycetaceae bacterium]